MISASLFMILWKGWGKLCAIPVLLSSFYMLYTYKQPDILISASHKLFAIKSEHDFYVSSRRSERFVLGQWERQYGLPEKSAKLLPYKGERKYHDHSFINCGEEGCRFTINGQNISIIRNNYILEQECDWADILISPDKVGRRQCVETVVIGRFASWEKGAHAIYLSQDQIKITTVAQSASNRPWSAYHDQ